MLPGTWEDLQTLRGIEIYRGRPIFYGLGEFIRQMDVIGLPAAATPNAASVRRGMNFR